MIKKFLYLIGALAVAAMLAASCEEPAPEETGKEDEKETETIPAPVFSLAVGDLTRTSVDFIIASDSPGDYAWAIVPEGQTISSAKALFETGQTGMFGKDNTQTVTYNALEGNKEYTLYAAVRKINPYTYSELKSEKLSTIFPYEDMITLEKVTTSSISYHIEKPEGAAAYKHLIVDYNDYLFFKNMVGVTYDSYVSAFGLPATDSKTYDYEWSQDDSYGTYTTYFYSDTKYLIIAGPCDAADLDSQVGKADVKYIEFTTPKAEECPYEVAVTVDDITSMTATVTIVPEEGVDRYRAMVLSEDDYLSFLLEGEEMIRRVVIDAWDNTENEYTESVTMPMQGLTPNTRYHVCAVVFDKDMRELYVEETFTTTEPTGPKPEIEVTEIAVDEPWNSASANLKIRNAVSAMSFVHTRTAVDNVLNAPGNEDLTIEDLIPTNGVSLTSDALAKALSEDGAVMMFENLSANTDYVFAVQATNPEKVTTSFIYEFKTGAEPVVETGLFGKLKGEYTATISDLDGKTHTFDVTIADGVNDATREDYKARNLLVCLGWDPVAEYHSPQDLLDKGWAKTEEEANRNYGPKWFLQIDQDEKVTTYKHSISSSYWDEVNNTTVVTYSAEGEEPMASFDGNTYWFKGTFWRDYANNANRDDEAVATTLIHDVDYNETTGVITVKPVTHYKSWSSKGQTVTEYPGVAKGDSWANTDVVFCGNSSLVLTPKTAPKQAAMTMKAQSRNIVAPRIRPMDIRESKPVIRRTIR